VEANLEKVEENLAKSGRKFSSKTDQILEKWTDSFKITSN